MIDKEYDRFLEHAVKDIGAWEEQDCNITQLAKVYEAAYFRGINASHLEADAVRRHPGNLLVDDLRVKLLE